MTKATLFALLKDVGDNENISVMGDDIAVIARSNGVIVLDGEDGCDLEWDEVIWSDEEMDDEENQ